MTQRIRRRPASPWFPSPTSCPTIPRKGRWRRWQRKPPKRATRCCARWRRWKTCASAPPRSGRCAGLWHHGFARDVLDIADNLQRALDAVPAEAKAAADPGLKALIEGVELTERSLLNALEKNGVKKFDPSGEKFDPEFPAGDVRGARSVGAGGHGGAGGAGRLHDRRARAAAGAGRRLQGRRQSGVDCGFEQN